MEVKSTTKSGTAVTISCKVSDLTVVLNTPNGIFKGGWGTYKDAEGIICRGEINGKETMICAQIPKSDYKKLMDMAKEAFDKNVPGLKELYKAIDDEQQYGVDFDKMMDNEFNDGVNPPKKPVIKSSSVAEQYPIAAAYIKAERWEDASHFAKSAAGRKAKEAIAEGEDYTLAIKEMEEEWSKYCTENVD